MLMQITVSDVGDAKGVAVSGRLDTEAASEFEARCGRLIQSGARTIILNLSVLEYLSSAGLSALLNLAKFAQTRQCRLFLCSPSQPVKQILQLSGLDKVLPLRDTVDQALVE